MRPGEGLARPHLEETWGLDLVRVVIGAVVLAAISFSSEIRVHALESGLLLLAVFDDGESIAVRGIVPGLVLGGELAEVGVGIAQVVAAV